MRYQIVLGVLLLVTSTPALIAGQNPVQKQNSATASDLAERTLLDGKLSMLVPEDFTVMTEELLKAKYPAEQRPTLVLTNPRGTVNVALNHTQNPLLPSQIGEIHGAMEGMFRKLYPSASWNRSEVMPIGDRDFFVLDLMTPGGDADGGEVVAGDLQLHQGTRGRVGGDRAADHGAISVVEP